VEQPETILISGQITEVFEDDASNFLSQPAEFVASTEGAPVMPPPATPDNLGTANQRSA
jgi:hypothetical protein